MNLISVFLFISLSGQHFVVVFLLFCWTYDRTCSADTVFICFLPRVHILDLRCIQIKWSVFCIQKRMINVVRNQFSIWNELIRMCKGMMSAMQTDEQWKWQKKKKKIEATILVAVRMSRWRERKRIRQTNNVYAFGRSSYIIPTDHVTLRWL